MYIFSMYRILIFYTLYYNLQQKVLKIHYIICLNLKCNVLENNCRILSCICSGMLTLTQVLVTYRGQL